MKDGIKSQDASETYNELVLGSKSKNNHNIQEVQKGVVENLENNLDNDALSFGFSNIVKAILSLAPQEVNEETGFPNYYITGSLAMNLLPLINKITLSNGQTIEFDDNIRKMFEICYRKINYDLDLISTDDKITVHDIAFKNSKRAINGRGISRELKDLGFGEDTINTIFKNCINCNKYILSIDDSMNTDQGTKNFYYCKATIKSENGDFDVFMIDPIYLLGYKFAAYLKAKHDKDKTDFMNLYKGLELVYGEAELKHICSKYKELRPDLFG